MRVRSRKSRHFEKHEVGGYLSRRQLISSPRGWPEEMLVEGSKDDAVVERMVGASADPGARRRRYRSPH
jgi:hypothetical protein